MSKGILDQILGLLNGLSEKEIASVHKKTRAKKVELSPIELTRSRQTRYRDDIRSGKALHGKKVR